MRAALAGDRRFAKPEFATRPDGWNSFAANTPVTPASALYAHLRLRWLCGRLEGHRIWGKGGANVKRRRAARGAIEHERACARASLQVLAAQGVSRDGRAPTIRRQQLSITLDRKPADFKRVI